MGVVVIGGGGGGGGNNKVQVNETDVSVIDTRGATVAVFNRYEDAVAYAAHVEAHGLPAPEAEET